MKEQIERAKTERVTWSDKNGVIHTDDKLTPEAQARITKLKARRKELHAELDALV